MSVLTFAPPVLRGAPTSSTPTTHRDAEGALRRMLTVTDLVAAALAWGLAGPLVLAGPLSSVAAVIALAVLLTPLTMIALGLYRTDVCVARLVEVTRTIAAGTVAVVVILALDRAGLVHVVDREALWAGTVSTLFILTGRSGFRAWVHAQRAAGRYHRPIVLIGRSDEVAALLTFYAEHPEVGYSVQGVLGDEDLALASDERWLGSYQDHVALDAATEVGTAVLAMGGLPSTETNRLLRHLRSRSMRVHLHTGLTQISVRRLRALPLAHEPLHYVTDAGAPALRHAAKRTLDLVGASIALVLCSPVLLTAMVLVRLDDGGPAMFRQRRVGRRGEVFTMLKLRTMDADAEARRTEIIDLNERTGPLFKVESDPRVTRVGRWLRELSIDELPQLFNVLRGEMSLVGPRPALPAETALFDLELRRRHEVRPGMTGLWQVEARDKPSIYAYRRLDLFYVDNWTVVGDLGILVRTAGSIVTRGARRALRGAG